HEAASGYECVYKPFRQDHEAKTERIEQHLREGADVDHATGTVERLQGSNGVAGVAVLRVVVVFDDPCVRACGPAKEFQTPLCGHHQTHGKLICGRDISKLCLGRKLASCFYDEAAIVHRYWNDTRTCSAECFKSAGIPRVFHPDLIARFDEEAAE